MNERNNPKLREELATSFGDDLLFADSFDSAIIGVSIGCDSERVIYDTEKMAEILVTFDDMTEQEAWEFLEFNTFNAYVGEHTPIYLSTIQEYVSVQIQS
jgi:hypothetical protein|tara:strand:- start:3539 stop:3838 length:300 start_codon:yes stop_codon:yes gene_type:complete